MQLYFNDLGENLPQMNNNNNNIFDTAPVLAPGRIAYFGSLQKRNGKR